MSTTKFNLIPNDIEGIQSYKTRITIFEYLKNKIDGNGILFSQETHPLKENKIRLNDKKSDILHPGYM